MTEEMAEPFVYSIATYDGYSSAYLLRHYHIKPIIVCIYAWFIIIATSAKSNNIIEGSFLHCGPGEAYFITIPINTWSKWGCVMIYSFFSQVLYSFVNITLSPFLTNVIRDHKSKTTLPVPTVLFIVFSYKVYGWVHEILEVFLTLTLQLQYYLPALIADVIITMFSTWKYNKKNVPIAIY